LEVAQRHTQHAVTLPTRAELALVVCEIDRYVTNSPGDYRLSLPWITPWHRSRFGRGIES
jgi:hypothetical protein